MLLRQLPKSDPMPATQMEMPPFCKRGVSLSLHTATTSWIQDCACLYPKTWPMAPLIPKKDKLVQTATTKFRYSPDPPL